MENSTTTFSLQDISSQGLERSRKLTNLIIDEINELRENVMSFDRFMSLALYAESLGYYVGGNEIFGDKGDFVTAPESGDLFGLCLAEQCREVLSGDDVAIAEFGAGTGALVETILRFFDGKILAKNFNYSIIEPSTHLAEVQKLRLSKIDSTLVENVTWYTTFPDEDFSGVAIANEMFDAMPARRFIIRRGEVKELGVSYDGQNFFWKIKELSDIPALIRKRLARYPEGYITEHIEEQEKWFPAFKNFFKEGVLFIADYGYVDTDFFHLERVEGTLRCYFNHRAHDNPFIAIGLQDITTSVNFSYLAESALSAGLNVEGFTSQAKFLIGNKLETKISTLSKDDNVNAYRIAQEAKRLILPEQMGESFKFMACSIGSQHRMSGFADDERFRLG